MGETEISWTHRPGTVGRTWNVAQGCSRISTGCERCYAERTAARFAESGWSKGLINLKTRRWNGTVRLAAHKLAEPLSWRNPSTVFVNSMSDLFHDGFTNEEIAAVFGVMAAAPQHTFQVLTKRARRMRVWFEWAESQAGCTTGRLAFILGEAAKALPSVPRASHGEKHGPQGTSWPLPNVWFGVSVENQDAADERIPELLATPAAVRFLSCEPLLGEVDLTVIGKWRDWYMSALEEQVGHVERPRIDWVIAGCESGHGARPCDVAWLRSLRDQCDAAGVAYFLKQASDGYWKHQSVGVSADTRVRCGDGSKRKGGGVIELPYLDGVQHCSFPEAR